MDAKRADVLTGLLLGTGFTAEGTLTPPAPVHLHVTIDARPSTGDDTAGMPGELGRLGRVSADTLRDLLDLTEHTHGTVDGALAVDQPCPGRPPTTCSAPGRMSPPSG